MSALLGITLGVVMAPLVYLLASRLLTGPAPLPRTVLIPLTLTCVVTGAAVTTLAGSGRGGAVGVYGLFAVAVLAASVVDVVERRIPNKITYPLILAGVFMLPWLTYPVTWWSLLAPLVGALASGGFGLINAMVADQGLGDVKLAAAIGAWMAHLGLVAWATGVIISQLLMVVAVATTRVRRRRAGLPPDQTPLGPSLAGGAILAVALTAVQI